MVVQLTERPTVTDDIEKAKQKPHEEKPAIEQGAGTKNSFTEMI
jgi:hypothetical protein